MKKILIVEDQVDVRRLLEIVFRSTGSRLMGVASGEEAVAAARRILPDLILLDVMLPGQLNGYDVARILKADPSTSACAIIVMTAKVQEGDRADAFAAGADDYIGKPFDLEELKGKAAKFLHR